MTQDGRHVDSAGDQLVVDELPKHASRLTCEIDGGVSLGALSGGASLQDTRVGQSVLIPDEFAERRDSLRLRDEGALDQIEPSQEETPKLDAGAIGVSGLGRVA